MNFVRTQTFDHQDNAEELGVLANAIWLIGQKRYDEAAKMLVQRHDKLMLDKRSLKVYDPREQAA